MQPGAMDFSLFNWIGLALAIVANIAIGFVWYAQWFPTGKIWLRETKMDMTQKVPAKAMAMSRASWSWVRSSSCSSSRTTTPSTSTRTATPARAATQATTCPSWMG